MKRIEEKNDHEPHLAEIVEMAEAERKRNARHFSVTHIKRGTRKPIDNAEQDVRSELTGRILMIRAQISAMPYEHDPSKTVAWPAE